MSSTGAPLRARRVSDKQLGGCQRAPKGPPNYPQSENEVTNFFASCELLCEECGEVSVTNFKPIFLGNNWQEILPPKNLPHTSLSSFWIFITLNFWERFCATKGPPNEKSRHSGWVFAVFLPFSPWSCCLAVSDHCQKHVYFLRFIPLALSMKRAPAYLPILAENSPILSEN